MEGQKESVGVWFYDFILRYFKVNTLESGSKDDFKTQTPMLGSKGNSKGGGKNNSKNKY